MIKNVLFCSVGGQGAVLASRVVALAALSLDLDVRACETIGMAQRGGSVITHVRYGDEPFFSPSILPGSADIMLAAEPGEAARNISYLAPGGKIFTVDTCLAPVTAGLTGIGYEPEPIINYLKSRADTMVLDQNALVAHCGSAKATNIALVGLALRYADMGLSMSAVAGALEKLLKPGLLKMNLAALYMDKV